jgi:leucyl/phenylalanyl-tRNA--protein transferase
MSKIAFPDPRRYQFSEWVLFGDYYYNARDIIGFGGEMTVGNLREAYRRGIFPWHVEGLPLPWFCPERRAILEFAEIRIGRSLRREYRKTAFAFSIDAAFDDVVEGCAQAVRNDGAGTWITPEFKRAYGGLHRSGDAHSVEVWDGTELVGGLYGVDAGGVFCGESMFFRRSNASKFALLHLVEHLLGRGSTWIDIQVMTPHFEALGAKEIERGEFLDRLEGAQRCGLELFPRR